MHFAYLKLVSQVLKSRQFHIKWPIKKPLLEREIEITTLKVFRLKLI